MSVQVGIQLERHSWAEYTKNLIFDLQKDFGDKIRPRLPELRSECAFHFGQELANSDEWYSLRGGILRRHFGLADPEPALKSIQKAVSDGVRVEFAPTTPSRITLGGISVTLLKDDYSHLLGLPTSSYTSISRNGAFEIPWLEWLLFGRGRILVAESEIVLTRKPVPGSRTEFTVMSTPKNRPARGGGVPPPFGGTADDNWLTRAAERSRELVYSRMLHALKVIYQGYS